MAWHGMRRQQAMHPPSGASLKQQRAKGRDGSGSGKRQNGDGKTAMASSLSLSLFLLLLLLPPLAPPEEVRAQRLREACGLMLSSPG